MLQQQLIMQQPGGEAVMLLFILQFVQGSGRTGSTLTNGAHARIEASETCLQRQRRSRVFRAGRRSLGIALLQCGAARPACSQRRRQPSLIAEHHSACSAQRSVRLRSAQDRLQPFRASRLTSGSLNAVRAGPVGPKATEGQRLFLFFVLRALRQGKKRLLILRVSFAFDRPGANGSGSRLHAPCSKHPV